MSSVTCLRCHSRKTRCSGYPACENCRYSSVECQPYTRRRRVDNQETLRKLQQRVQWLEQQIYTKTGLECVSIATGTDLNFAQQSFDTITGAEQQVPLETHDQVSSEQNTSLREMTQELPGGGDCPSVAASTQEISMPAFNATGETRYLGPSSGVPLVSSKRNTTLEQVVQEPTEDDDSFSAAISAPEISMLALNATGETRCLGPSSDVPLASHAAATAGSMVSNGSSSQMIASVTPRHRGHSPPTIGLTDEDKVQDEAEVETLVRSYQIWIHPLYPLFDMETLCASMRANREQEAAGIPNSNQTAKCKLQMAEYYLVLALGAIHHGRSTDQCRVHTEDLRRQSGPRRDPARLYLKSLENFDTYSRDLPSSVPLIRVILLRCIYGFSGKVGYSQWQMAGLAMRMAIEIGLHQSPCTLQVTQSEAEERNRAFWTAYIIEIILAYNLGRPPSIAEEHITANLPDNSSTMEVCLHHIRHRQIQGRIIAKVYGAARKHQHLSEAYKQDVISGLQTELDHWRMSLPEAYNLSPSSGYPSRYWERLYNGTTFVLHRASPLCSSPLATSLERCIRSAAAYVDDMIDVVRNSRVGLSWMLVQGVLFAGLTMLITARANFHKLLPLTGLQFFLADFPAWVRKCAICLAVMNERWNETLLSTLESRFEALANDTLRFISANISTSLEGNNFTGQTSTHDNTSGTTLEDQNVSQAQTWLIDDGLWNESAYMDFAIGNDPLISNGPWELFGADGMTDR